MQKTSIHYFLSITTSLMFVGLVGCSKPVEVTLKNPLNIARTNEVLRINTKSLEKRNPGFNANHFAVYDNDVVVPYQRVSTDSIGGQDILLLLSFKPNETKELVFDDNKEGKKANKETQAYLGEKVDYKLKDGNYTGGRFVSIDFTKVPVTHVEHDALYQFEGPGWESEEIAYRVYLDDRNRTDIFGKKEDGLFLNIMGKNDLVSDGNESYQRGMLSWGRDIFKVGNSLGIGSVATYYNNKVTTVSDVDSVNCKVFNGNLISGITTKHYGWKLDKKYNITINYSIPAKSRLTKVNVSIDKKIDNFCTGLAKHKDTYYLKSNGDGWNYIALWGKQTLADDSLGIAVIYNKSYLLNISEDDLSYFVILKPDNDKLNYYFCAAWEEEPNGIKSKKEFIDYLNNEIKKLDNPIKVEI